MKELLSFWKWLNENFDIEELEEYLEPYDFDVDVLVEANLSSMSHEQIDSLFGNLIGVYMDVSGTDNLGDVYELLKDTIHLDDDRINVLLS